MLSFKRLADWRAPKVELPKWLKSKGACPIHIPNTVKFLCLNCYHEVGRLLEQGEEGFHHDSAFKKHVILEEITSWSM